MIDIYNLINSFDPNSNGNLLILSNDKVKSLKEEKYIEYQIAFLDQDLD